MLKQSIKDAVIGLATDWLWNSINGLTYNQISVGMMLPARDMLYPIEDAIWSQLNES